MKNKKEIMPAEARTRSDLLNCISIKPELLKKIDMTYHSYRNLVYSKRVKARAELCIVMGVRPEDISDWDKVSEIRKEINKKVDMAIEYKKIEAAK